MDHPVSQQCRIYQLEEIRIKADKTPGKLVEWIQGLANRCNFPTDVEKERPPVLDGMCPQWHRPDQEAIGYENQSNFCWDAGCVPHTYMPITDNMSSMGLSTKAVSAV